MTRRDNVKVRRLTVIDENGREVPGVARVRVEIVPTWSWFFRIAWLALTRDGVRLTWVRGNLR